MSANDLAASACAARNWKLQSFLIELFTRLADHLSVSPTRSSVRLRRGEKSKDWAGLRGSDQDRLSRPAQAEDGSVPPTEAALFFRGGLPCRGQSPKLDCYVGGANCEPARDCAGSVSRVSVHHWSIEP